MKSRSTRDPDPGPPGLLVVAYGSLHGADDLHHFLVVHDSCPLGWEPLFRETALVSLTAGPPELLERRALHSRRGVPGCRGNRESRRAGPRRAAGGRLEGATKGGPRETRAVRERAATGQGHVRGRARCDRRAERPAVRRAMGRGGPRSRVPRGEGSCPCGDSAMRAPSREPGSPSRPPVMARLRPRVAARRPGSRRPARS